MSSTDIKIESLVAQARDLDEYDITFTNGQLITLTLCLDEGDSIQFFDQQIIAKIAIRQGLGLNGSDLPPEDITLYKQHILVVQHRKRKIDVITAEQRAAWQATLNGTLSQPIIDN